MEDFPTLSNPPDSDMNALPPFLQPRSTFEERVAAAKEQLSQSTQSYAQAQKELEDDMKAISEINKTIMSNIDGDEDPASMKRFLDLRKGLVDKRSAVAKLKTDMEQLSVALQNAEAELTNYDVQEAKRLEAERELMETQRRAEHQKQQQRAQEQQITSQAHDEELRRKQRPELSVAHAQHSGDAAQGSQPLTFYDVHDASNANQLSLDDEHVVPATRSPSMSPVFESTARRKHVRTPLYGKGKGKGKMAYKMAEVWGDGSDGSDDDDEAEDDDDEQSGADSTDDKTSSAKSRKRKRISNPNNFLRSLDACIDKMIDLRSLAETTFTDFTLEMFNRKRERMIRSVTFSDEVKTHDDNAEADGGGDGDGDGGERAPSDPLLSKLAQRALNKKHKRKHEHDHDHEHGHEHDASSSAPSESTDGQEKKKKKKKRDNPRQDGDEKGLDGATGETAADDGDETKKKKRKPKKDRVQEDGSGGAGDAVAPKPRRRGKPDAPHVLDKMRPAGPKRGCHGVDMPNYTKLITEMEAFLENPSRTTDPNACCLCTKASQPTPLKFKASRSSMLAVGACCQSEPPHMYHIVCELVYRYIKTCKNKAEHNPETCTCEHVRIACPSCESSFAPACYIISEGSRLGVHPETFPTMARVNELVESRSEAKDGIFSASEKCDCCTGALNAPSLATIDYGLGPFPAELSKNMNVKYSCTHCGGKWAHMNCFALYYGTQGICPSCGH